MKTLNDGTEIVDRVYYYMLDFNNEEKGKYSQTFIQQNFQKDSVKDLSAKEFSDYFEYAYYKDIKKFDKDNNV